MPVVDIKGVGKAQFPDDMMTSDIRSFLRQKYSPELSRQDALTPRPATMQASNPSLASRAGTAIGEGLNRTGIISDRFGAQQIGKNVTSIGEFLPVIGDATAGDEFGQALKQGNSFGMAMGALGAIPVVGDAAKRLIKAKVSRIGDSDLRPLFSEDNRLTNINPNGGMASAIFNENPIKSLNGDVKVYRATIGDELRPNDFVAINKGVAEAHLNDLLDRGEKANIIEATVTADDLMMGNDATEFIFSPNPSIGKVTK